MREINVDDGWMGRSMDIAPNNIRQNQMILFKKK